MANGKFSNPRPNRDEEREIEQAFRQVTGQAPPPAPPVPDVPDLDASTFDLIFDVIFLKGVSNHINVILWMMMTMLWMKMDMEHMLRV